VEGDAMRFVVLWTFGEKEKVSSRVFDDLAKAKKYADTKRALKTVKSCDVYQASLGELKVVYTPKLRRRRAQP